jgi:uncharacterized membrane protein
MEHHFNPAMLERMMDAGMEQRMPWNLPPYPAATAYDPAPLVALLEAQCAEWPALAVAARACTRQWAMYHGLCYLCDPNDALTHGPFKAMLWLTCPQRGTVVVEVLPDGRIGSVDTRAEEDPPVPDTITGNPHFPVHTRMTVVFRKGAA